MNAVAKIVLMSSSPCRCRFREPRFAKYHATLFYVTRKLTRWPRYIVPHSGFGIEMADREHTWTVGVGAEQTVAHYEPAAASRRATFVFAHGAGGHMEDRGMLALSRELCARGLDVVRFNF